MRKKLVWVVFLVVSLLGLSGCSGSTFVDIGPINVIGCSCGGLYDLCYPGMAQIIKSATTTTNNIYWTYIYKCTSATSR